MLHKGMICILGRTKWESGRSCTTQNATQFETYEFMEIFIYYFWTWVTETMKIKTVDNREIL